MFASELAKDPHFGAVCDDCEKGLRISHAMLLHYKIGPCTVVDRFSDDQR